MSEATFQQWAVVELFGHQQIAGLVSEQVIAGQGFVRVDVPACAEREAFTRLFGTGAIYSITPTSEEVATAYATARVERPIEPFQLSLPEKAIARDASGKWIEPGDFEEDEDEEDDIGEFEDADVGTEPNW